jgi:tetratricopeptide (TPR) repeat protein
MDFNRCRRVRSRRVRSLVFALVLSLVLWATPGLAQPTLDPDSEVARNHYNNGSSYYDSGDYVAALKEFEAGRALAPKPAFDFNIARCHDRLGHWAEAASEYEHYLAADPDAPDSAELRVRIDLLKRRAAEEPSASTGPSPPPLALVTPPPKRLVRYSIAFGAVTLALGVAGTGTYLSEWSDYTTARQRCDHKCDPATLGGVGSRISAAQAAGGTLLGIAAAAAVVDIVLLTVDARRERATRRSLRARSSF